MKLLICSDIHGGVDSTAKILEIYKAGSFDKLVILGDVLYHGPRNDLPIDYAPKKVIELLNAHKQDILCVRGNCDTEVDQMVLDFPILADYSVLYVDGLRIYATHGHRFDKSSSTHLQKGDILLHGHTHVPVYEDFGDENVYINPGSVTIPKNNFPRTYIVYENRTFTTYDFEENVVYSRNF